MQRALKNILRTTNGENHCDESGSSHEWLEWLAGISFASLSLLFNCESPIPSPAHSTFDHRCRHSGLIGGGVGNKARPVVTGHTGFHLLPLKCWREWEECPPARWHSFTSQHQMNWDWAHATPHRFLGTSALTCIWVHVCNVWVGREVVRLNVVPTLVILPSFGNWWVWQPQRPIQYWLWTDSKSSMAGLAGYIPQSLNTLSE